MDNPEYRICLRCVMDTTDPGIEFDEQGVCNRCKTHEIRIRKMPRAEDRERLLNELVANIKASGVGKDYDCLIGVSGGVDSTYVAWLVKSLGLRPLAVHMDNGWDSNLAVENIEHCLKALSIDLFTNVLDWDEFRDLQLSFLKASTPDAEIPTDHAILATLYHRAAQLGLKYILYGANVRTEGLSVPTWSHGHYDWKYIRSLHARFGCTPLRAFPHLTLLDYFRLRHVLRIQFVNVLDYIDYQKSDAMATIQRELGWRPYDQKHHESIYTRFYQNYILPRKFGAEKRKLHLATLVVSGQITREQALAELASPLASPEELRRDKLYACKKLGITEDQLANIMAEAPRTFWDYPSYEKSPLMKLYRLFRPLPLPARTPCRHPEAADTENTLIADTADKL